MTEVSNMVSVEHLAFSFKVIAPVLFPSLYLYSTKSSPLHPFHHALFFGHSRFSPAAFIYSEHIQVTKTHAETLSLPLTLF